MPVVFEPATAAEVLGGMITPAVLISASGTLTLSTTNRLGRIVDRVRDLLRQAEELPPWDPRDEDAQEKRAHISDQIASQTVRIGYLQVAVISLYVAITLLVGSSLAIGLSAAARGGYAWTPVVLGLLGALALFAAAVLLIQDARMAVRSAYREMAYIRRMVARRTGAPLPASGPDAGAGPAPAA
ncbi:MAG TPA: DUF2721 domain-containing protein [Urbifossiella sp.]|jgi:ABC-type transport system involved in cytochrome bd biosynthesis fused ATPase/permease subunit|nr:DUF2721 domain-containing protein [Urbifossiella sp.]